MESNPHTAPAFDDMTPRFRAFLRYYKGYQRQLDEAIKRGKAD